MWSQVNLTFVPCKPGACCRLHPVPSRLVAFSSRTPPPNSPGRHVIGGPVFPCSQSDHSPALPPHLPSVVPPFLCWPRSGWGGVSAGHSPVHSCLSSLPRLAYDQWLCVPCSLSASSSPVYSPRGAPSLSTVVSKLTMCWSVGICGLKSCGGTPAGVLQPPTWWWPMDDLPSRHPRPKVLFPVRTGSFCSVINSG